MKRGTSGGTRSVASALGGRLSAAAALVASAFCVATAPAPSFGATVYWKANAGGDITVASNWNTASDGSGSDVEPAAGDTLDFSKITANGYSLTGSFGDDRIFAGATFALTGNNYVELTGSLHVYDLLNANHLLVETGGSLTVENELKWNRSTAKNESNNMGRLLQGTRGTVTVKGIAVGSSAGANGACYATRDKPTSPLRVGGIDYNAGGYIFPFYLYAYGNSSGRATAEWIVGGKGMTFSAGGSASNEKNCFVVDGANATLHSQADWSIETSGNTKSVADIYIDGKTLTIDTKDYDDNSVQRTVTLNGRIYSKSTSGTGLSITGNGKFVIATKVTSGNEKKTRIHNTLAVSNTATLQLNEDAEYAITNMSLAAGTTLALPNSTADSFVPRSIESVALPSSGTVNLVIDGASLSRGTYTILSCVPENYETFSVSGTAVSGKFCTLTDDGSSLCMIVGEKVFWKENAGGDITSSSNWTNALGEAVVPQAYDYLDFSKITTYGYTLSGSFDDDRIFAGAKFALTGNASVSLTGSLHFLSLLNASHLSIASGASLTVENDLTWNRNTSMSGAENTLGRILQGNNGTVTVKGRVVCQSSGVEADCYPTRDAPSSPMRVGGIDYKAGGYRLEFGLMSYGGATAGRKPASWIIGDKGLTFSWGGTGKASDKHRYTVVNANATLYSQADWSIGTSGHNNSDSDIFVNNTTLIVDTKDYDDNTVPRTVTLNGRIGAGNTSGTSLRVTGNGTFVLATEVTSGTVKRTQVYNTWSIEDTATLQLQTDAKYLVSNVTLAAGATLSMPGSSATEFAAPDAAKDQQLPSLTLPAAGTAYLRIDGPVLEKGKYTVLDSVPTGYKQHLTVVGTALGGRPARLVDDGSTLKLSVGQNGMMIIVR